MIPYGSEFVVVHTLVVTHRAFIKAGPAAVGFWTGALAYTRRERLDGWVPEEGLAVILGVGAKEARRLAELLVGAGLFARDDERGGYGVLRYAEMGNETSDEIDARLSKAEGERARERERKAVLRAASRQPDGTFGARGGTSPTIVPPPVPPDNAGTTPGQRPDVATPVQPQTEQSRAEQKQIKEQKTLVGPDGPTAPSEDVRTVFEAWATERRRLRPTSKPKLDPKRAALIRTRLKTFSVEELCRAVVGIHRSAYNLGENDTRTEYLDLELAIRDAGRIERFGALADDAPAGEAAAPYATLEAEIKLASSDRLAEAAAALEAMTPTPVPQPPPRSQPDAVPPPRMPRPPKPGRVMTLDEIETLANGPHVPESKRETVRAGLMAERGAAMGEAS